MAILRLDVLGVHIGMKLSYPLVIVWTWWAWLRCALHLKESWFSDFLLIGDRAFDDPHTTQARWGINAALHTMDVEDTPLLHAIDTFREGQFLANPDMVEYLADHAPGAIDDLVRWWAQFHKEEDGRLTQRFFWAHSYRRTVFSWDETGKEMIRVMSARAKDLWIEYMEYCYVYDLVVVDNTVAGVRLINLKTDELIDISAARVVFATGWFSNVYWRSSSRNKENFWDWIALAYRAWVIVWDMELVQFHPTWLLYPEEKFWELVTEAVRGEGWLLFNADWERFMSRYDSAKMELSTRDVVARANFHEIIEGRWTENGWVYLDVTHRSKEYILERLPKMYEMILKYNWINISQEPVEVAPTTHYTMWWIYIDAIDLTTNIEWFYAIGECTMWVHWANRLWGNSLMETMVFWKRLAEILLSQVDNLSLPELSFPDTDYFFHESVDWLDWNKILKDVREHMWRFAWILRTEDELRMLSTYLDWVINRMWVQWLLPLDKVSEKYVLHTRLYSVLTLWKLICLWALERKESRWAHFRIDYPEFSDNFSSNILWRLKWSEHVFSLKVVPDMSDTLLEWLEKYETTTNYWHSE